MKAANRARQAVARAIRLGKLKRGRCEKCGTRRDVHGHHPNYSRPLHVRWLCRSHHEALHAQKNPGNDYVRMTIWFTPEQKEFVLSMGGSSYVRKLADDYYGTKNA